MIILGIDPGSRITGYGIIRWPDTYITCGTIKTLNKPMVERLQIIHKDLKRIISKYQPEIAAIEEVFVHKNAQSALKLGHARGAAMLAVAEYQIPLAEYAARLIKQTVTGYGGADKLQMQTMVQQTLKLSQPPSTDAADALAIAICHGHLFNSHLLHTK